MSDGDDRATDPSEVFELVAHETRFDILQSVWELTKSTDEAASFAAIRSEAGVRDSGQFNYHLDKLTPQFVRKAEGGYVVTHAGARLVGAVVSGIYTDDGTSVDPRPVGECPNCEDLIEARYDAEQLDIECTDCGVTITNIAAPPVIAAGHDPEDLPSVYSKYLLTETERINRGFCPSCSGRVDTSVRESEDDPGDAFADHLGVVHECRECGADSRSVVGASVLGHPAVVSLYHDAGIDVRETPIWELTALLDAPGEIVAEAPLRVETTVEVAGEAVDLLLDEDLNVIDYERRPVRTDPE
ncbi:DUF7351 domain-containing protein [Halosimplex marinum]|uniref:DUF7351 domain-containing protein n=1 Tax=Halosimplex marinum TaxID=3396620 RepID=UPI003F54DCBA